MPRLEEFVEWVNAKPTARWVKIDIGINAEDGPRIVAGDIYLDVCQTIKAVADIDLEAKKANREKADYERLRAKYATTGEA